MKLELRSTIDAVDIKKPTYQRNISKNIVSKIKGYMEGQKEWTLPPIIVNDDNEVIDGQHRLEAYKMSNVEYDIAVVVMDGINKNDFILFNSGKAVPVAHKIKIHDKVMRVLHAMNISVSPSSISTINASDMAKSVYILKYKKCRTPNQLDVFTMLDSIPDNELLTLSEKAWNIKDKYIESLEPNSRFRQIWFLFYSYVVSIGVASEIDISRSVKKLITTAGGDLSLFENRSLFLAALNYKLHNKHGFKIFEKETI